MFGILFSSILISGIVDIITKETPIGPLSVPYWVICAIGLCLIVLIIIAAIIIAKNSGKKKEANAKDSEVKEEADEADQSSNEVAHVEDEETSNTVEETESEFVVGEIQNNDEIAEEVEETPVEETVAEETAAEETAIEETPVEETPVEETTVEEVSSVTEVEEAPMAVEEQKDEVPVEAEEVEAAPVETAEPEKESETVAAADEVAEEKTVEVPMPKPAQTKAKKPAPKKKPQEETIDVPLEITKPKKAKKEPVAETNADKGEDSAANENATKKGVLGKYEICLRSEGYCFSLIANNGQLLYDSFGFSSVEGAKAGIETFKKAVKEGNFFASGDKFGRYRFILNKRYQGQNYSTKAACESSIKSVIRFADTTKIIELEPTPEELADYEQSLTEQKKATDIDWEAVAKEEENTPRLGTFESYEDENGDFRFYLVANNKQILYTSSIYASASTVRNAIDNFKKAVYIGNFVIGKDKFGKFRYILRSSNSVTYVGESYTTETQAKKSSESVKRFVKSATILPCKKYVPEEQ